MSFSTVLFFFVFLIFPLLFVCFKLLALCCSSQQRIEPASGNRRRDAPVRRTTVYTITADPRGNDPANDFTDFFWDGLPHASSSQNEPAKDDKDLPTYEEVMQLEMTQQTVRSTTVTPASNNTTTSSVVVPVIPVATASTI